MSPSSVGAASPTSIARKFLPCIFSAGSDDRDCSATMLAHPAHLKETSSTYLTMPDYNLKINLAKLQSEPFNFLLILGKKAKCCGLTRKLAAKLIMQTKQNCHGKNCRQRNLRAPGGANRLLSTRINWSRAGRKRSRKSSETRDLPSQLSCGSWEESGSPMRRERRGQLVGHSAGAFNRALRASSLLVVPSARRQGVD